LGPSQNGGQEDEKKYPENLEQLNLLKREDLDGTAKDDGFVKSSRCKARKN
jgi:hypothetical protein